MKIYRSIELGAAELNEKFSNETDVEIHYELMTDEELLHSDFDLIELSEKQNQAILSTMPLLDWPIQSTGAVDAFVREKNKFKPIHLSATAFVSFLQSKQIAVDIAKYAVLIGDYSFLITYAISLAKLGFKKIYLVSPNNINYKNQLQAVQKFLFNVQLRQLTLDEMANIADTASLLAIDFNLNEHPDLVETLTYFNFVAEKAIFFDLQNFLNDSLSSEAEKASLRVLDSVEFHLHKYRLFQKNHK
ncbi:hypothetical protein CIK05_10420 [Bdellovibrio sp. qaytius]|nr:hypothetical protein CIK05_10420 [Bdellovibrio sp. qaytius]